MAKQKQIKWLPILQEISEWCEDKFEISIVIDKDIIAEIEAMVDITLDNFEMDNPNVAKVSSSVAFWIRKLKPIYFDEKTENKFLAINELVGLLVGLSITRRYLDDHSKEKFSIPSRILTDWTSSFRVNSHSPHSSAIAFELLTSEN